MNEKKYDQTNFDPKNQWINRVKNHKRNQYGLPALSSLSAPTNEGIFSRKKKKQTTYYVRVKNGSRYNDGIASADLTRDVKSALSRVLRQHGIEMKSYDNGLMSHGSWMFTGDSDVERDVYQALEQIKSNASRYVQKDAHFYGVRSSDSSRANIVKSMIVGPTTSKSEEFDKKTKLDKNNKNVRLNKNAGDVETSQKIFNSMQPEGSVNVDSVNGNVSSDTITESLNNDKYTLTYHNIPVEVVTRAGNPQGYYNANFGNWLPDDDETTELLIDWDYSIDEQDVVELLQDDPEVLSDLGISEETSDEEIERLLTNKLDYLFDKYNDKIKEYFFDMAIEDAQEKYEYQEDYPEYDSYDESLENDSELDDMFDMSMRTF